MCVFISFSFAEQSPSIAATIPKQNNNQQILENITNNSEQLEERKYYQIELVLFEHRNDTGTKSEFWPSTKNQNNISESETEAIDNKQTLLNSELNPKQTQNIYRHLASYNLITQRFIPLDKDFVTLNPDQYLLRDEYTRIKQSSHYDAMAHLGWIQPGLSEKEAKSIELNQHDWSGSITITLSRYLHANIDLISSRQICKSIPAETPNPTKNIETQVNDSASDKAYDPDKPTTTEKIPTVEISIDSSAPQVTCSEQAIVFQQSRKMRSRELHYIDNPAMGILILITPVEKASQSEQQAPQQSSPQQIPLEQRKIDIESASRKVLDLKNILLNRRLV